MSNGLRLGLYAGIALFFAAALWMTLNTYTLISDGQTLNGRVIAIDTVRATSTGAGRPGWVQRPRVSTLLPSGEAREFYPKVGSYRSSFEVGQRVELLYHPASPEPLVLKSFATTWLFPLILYGMGLLLLGVTWLLKRIMPPPPKASD